MPLFYSWWLRAVRQWKHTRLKAVYGDYRYFHTAVVEWWNNFWQGRDSIKDLACPRSARVAAAEENVRKLLYRQIYVSKLENLIKRWAWAWELFIPPFIVFTIVNLLLSGLHDCLLTSRRICLGPYHCSIWCAVNKVTSSYTKLLPMVNLGVITMNQNANCVLFLDFRNINAEHQEYLNVPETLSFFCMIILDTTHSKRFKICLVTWIGKSYNIHHSHVLSPCDFH